MKRLDELLGVAMEGIKARARPWESLGEQRDELLNLLWVELAKEKPRINCTRLQRIDFDLLYVILKSIPPGEHGGTFSSRQLVHDLGLEMSSVLSRRLTFSLRRLGTFVLADNLCHKPLRLTVPYLMTDIRFGSREHRALWSLCRQYGLEELREALIKAENECDAAARETKQRQPQEFNFSYKEYLLSDHWQEVRRRTLKRDGYRCRMCNTRGQLSVHHRTYERLGSERDSDVITLCKRCHEVFHENRRLAPKDPSCDD